MLLPGKLTIGFLQEDNPQKFYFRVRPLIVQEGETFRVAENIQEEFQDDGFIRIVPDKNELNHFKNRMRALGDYCLLDLRRHPNDNDKIRPNKNHAAENGDRNAFIMYSDVVFATTPLSLAEVVEVEGVPGERLIPQPGTPYVALLQKGRLVGLYRWIMQEMGARLNPESAVPMDKSPEELEGRLFTVSVDGQATRRILVDLGQFGAGAEETAPAQAIEPVAQETPAPAPAPEVIAEPQPAAEPPRPEKVEKIEKPEKIERADKPEKVERSREKKEEREAKPWLQQTPFILPRGMRIRESNEQCGFNPRRGPSIKEILDDMWRRSRVDQLGHPVPGDTQSVPAANPIEAAMDAVSQVWDLPEARTGLVDELLKLRDMADMLGLTGQENAVQARSLRIGEEKLQQMEADRLKLICEIDELKKKRLDTRTALLQEIEQTHKRDLESTSKQLENTRAELENTQQQTQRAKEASALAGAALTGLVTKQLDRKLADQLMEGHARDLLTAMLYGQEPAHQTPETYQPSAGELVTDLRVRFEEAGFTLSNDDAVNLLICLAQGHILLIGGPSGSGKSLFARTLGAALGLKKHGRYAEMQVPYDLKHLGDQIEAASPNGVPLIKMGALRALLRQNDGLAPSMLVLDEANCAPIERYAAELLTLGEPGAPCQLSTPVETIPLSDQLRVVMTLCEGTNGLPLTEKLLDRAWTLRLPCAAADTPWRAKTPALPEAESAVSLDTLKALFAPVQEVPGEVQDRMNTLRKKLAAKGVLLSRRALNDTYDYCAAAIPLMTAQPLEVLDRALAQRVMPSILACASLDALHDISMLFVDMPRCLELLSAPLPLPAF